MENRIFTKFNQFCIFFCWKTSKLKIFARLPVSGYCPGQTMNLKLDVINNSDQEVFHFLVYFIKVKWVQCKSKTVKCFMLLGYAENVLQIIVKNQQLYYNFKLGFMPQHVRKINFSKKRFVVNRSFFLDILFLVCTTI